MLHLRVNESKKAALKNAALLVFTGGEEGIRTPGTLRYTSFPGAHNRPLCHLSSIMRTKVEEKLALQN